MFPAAMVMCSIAHAIDEKLMIGAPFDNLAGRMLGLALVMTGGLWVWYVYGYLFLLGEGSPGTHVDGGPVRLVVSGPYTAIRHPSVLGKFLGVIGLGILWNSAVFLVGFVPVLLVYSLVTNRLIQERFCVERFGERYVQYRDRVPMLFPSPAGLRRWWTGEPALPEHELPSAHPPEIKQEFRFYLLGLVLLVALFGGVLWGLS